MINRDTICIVGPTACHKTEISIKLAQHFDCEIISADSVSVYRGMDIGSAKPTQEERQLVKHHLIDCADYTDDSFSVFEYQRLAREAVDSIRSRGKTPLIVGGSGLYVDAIYSDMSFAYPTDREVRAELEKKYADKHELAYSALKAVDTRTAARVSPNDFKRIIRALEVFECSGRPFSAFLSDFESIQKRKRYSAVKIGLNMEREHLYERIEKRVESMFDKGLEEEARMIYENPCAVRTASPLQSIGYRQLFNYFDGNCSLEQARTDCIKDTRHFAKRQLTWFKRDKETKWFMLDSYPDIDSAMREIIDYIIQNGEENELR